jgi:hypothetical protein
MRAFDMLLPSCRSAARATVALVLALACFALPAGRAGADAPDAGAPAHARLSPHARAMKQQQQRLLLQGAQARIARWKAIARELRRHPGQARPGARARRPGDWREAGGPQGAGVPAPMSSVASPTGVAAGVAPDVIVNSRAQDVGHVDVGQAEVMAAALGANVLMAWNDGLGFETTPNSDTQGYGYSVDGGASFTDGGAPPKLTGWTWTSDPLVTVNEKTGDFWYCALVNPSSTQNGIAVMKARFNAGAVTWSTPMLVRAGLNTAVAFDKPWIAADSLSGRLYLSYTVFSTTGDTIVFQRSNVGGTAWDNPVKLSSNAESGFVQGSRPVVGPDGELYVAWYSIGAVDVDYMKVRKSTDQGASFAASVDVASVFSNYGAGAPGFNRASGVTYPSVAVDRSSGPHRGRLYMAWNECIDFYDDPLGGTGSLSETEVNDAPATADAFIVGRTLRGTVSTVSDFDYFKFDGTAGQTLICFTDSIATGFDMSLRLYCTDGITRLALSAPGAGQNPLVVYTLPVTGTYYLRCASWDGSSTGRYRIITAFDTPTAGERSRDHRDVFATWSDGGTAWATPVRVSDSPAGFDDWLPEIAVAGDHADPRVGSGRPYCLWYDWRESASICGGGSHVYLARSDNSGASWTSLGALTSTRTDWTSVGSDILPNQGDYLSLFANDAVLVAAWADGRNGDPDIYAAAVPLLATPVQVSLAEVSAGPGRVSLAWYSGGSAEFTATVERREAATDFTALGTTTRDGTGRMSFTDATVAPGGRYAYRISWLEGATPRASSEVWVDVPAAASFALDGARPNPASRGVFVSLSLPDAAPARLELLDVAGRRLAERQVSGAGAHTVDVSAGLALEPGVYLVRLTHGDQSLTARVTVIR